MSSSPGTWVTYVAGRAASLQVRCCRFEVLQGPDQGQSYELELPTIRVGARRVADLALTDPKVSGLHFELSLDEDGFRLRDFGSTNGTFVAGYRVRDVYLHPGTVIHLGDTRLKFTPLNRAVELPLSAADSFGGLVGRSAPMRELFARLERLAVSDSTVLVSGETGAGKELVAEALHERSRRAAGPFVIVDCGALPSNLTESELFGHERGAFTGALTSRAGAFERAHGGTLFLDEVGELPLELQPKLLRALESKQIRRVGGSRVLTVDIRVVAATHRDLLREVDQGRFREDLYYRLAVAGVRVPPLREHKEDIPLIVERLMAELPGGAREGLSEEALARLADHDWPGNVRELRNLLEQALLMPGAVEVQPPATGEAARVEPPPARIETPIDLTLPFKVAKQRVVDEFDRTYIARLLDRHGGNISQAARAAGIDRMSIHKILNRLRATRSDEE